MKRVVIRQFKLEDAEVLCPVALEPELRTNPEFYRKWAIINIASGAAYTGEINGTPVLAGGVRIMDEGQGYVWAVLTPDASRYRLSVIRAIREMLGILIDEFEFVTLIADSRKGFSASQRLLEHLGFRRYNENETHYLYIRNIT